MANDVASPQLHFRARTTAAALSLFAAMASISAVAAISKRAAWDLCHQLADIMINDMAPVHANVPRCHRHGCNVIQQCINRSPEHRHGIPQGGHKIDIHNPSAVCP